MKASWKPFPILVVLSLAIFVFGCTDSDDPEDTSDGDTEVADGDSEESEDIDESGEEDGDAAETSEAESEGDEESPDTDGDMDAIEEETEIEDEIDPIIAPHALCGMEEYEMLPASELGELISWQQVPLFSLTPVVVDLLLEEAGYTALSPVPYGSRVFQYRYSTQDKGKRVEATALLSVPSNAELPDDPFSFGLFLHGTSGFSDPCAPSRRDDGPAQAAMVAALGFIGVLPDYIGMMGMGETVDATHGYLVGEQVAIGSWDALRAAQILLETEIEDPVATDGRTVIWGGSQGGHAAMFTELFGPYYAPEYEVPAVVAAVPPLSVLPLLKAGMETMSPPTISLLAVLTTMRRWYGAPESLHGMVTNQEPYFLADNAESLLFVTEECNAGEGMDASEINELYEQEFIDKGLNERWDEMAPFDCYFRESTILDSSVPPLRYTPTLITLSENDDLVITPPQRVAFDELCEAGYQLEYIECMNAGHSDGAIWSLPEQVNWIRDRLAGVERDAENICKRKDPECCLGSPEGKCE